MSIVPLEQIGSSLLDFGKTLVERLIPDPAMKAKALLDLQALHDKGELDRNAQRLQELQMQSAEVSDARSLAKVNMVPQEALSFLYTIGYFGILGMLFSGQWHIPSGDNQGMFAGLMLVLTGAQTVILQFWFGSSIGSKQKAAVEAAKASS